MFQIAYASASSNLVTSVILNSRSNGLRRLVNVICERSLGSSWITLIWVPQSSGVNGGPWNYYITKPIDTKKERIPDKAVRSSLSCAFYRAL